jgi:c(7)-type cytochrome triheme protein
VQTAKRRLPARRSTHLLVFLVSCSVFGYLISANSSVNLAAPTEMEATSDDLGNYDNEDYSRFQHSNPMHSRLPCLLCHKRDDNTARPKLSGHLPCAGCHVQQFADNTSPMCVICHTNSATGALKAFPPLQSFNAKFDHGKHVRQASCVTCHRPSRRGVALSIPSGFAAHIACYQCHGPKTEVGGRNIGSCGVCHQPGRPGRNSEWAKAFSLNFSHAKHGAGKNLNCASCHLVRAGMIRGRQVSAPLASMHFVPLKAMSCSSCHNNKRAFGTGDFGDCKRCHTGRTFKF